jgi:hypothetical protein
LLLIRVPSVVAAHREWLVRCNWNFPSWGGVVRRGRMILRVLDPHLFRIVPLQTYMNVVADWKPPLCRVNIYLIQPEEVK